MANYEATKIGEVGGLGEVWQVAAPLHRQIKALEKAGVQPPYLVTPEETARIRNAGLSTDYTRTCIAPIGVKGEAPVLYKPSPLMNPLAAQIAVNAHRNSQYPVFNREFFEFAKETAKREEGLEPEDRTAFVLSSCEDYPLTLEMPDTRFILGREAKEYFEKFKHPSIELLNLPTGDLPKDKCIINYLGFGGPGSSSHLDCRNGGLDSEYRALGVKRTGEASAQNFSGYSLTEVKSALVIATPKTLEATGLSGVKDMVAGKLEQNLLETLRASGKQ